MPNTYIRQEQLQLNIPASVTVVGCGGIGSWVAIMSAMSGVPSLYLFDDDIMEESNMNRLPFCQASLNRPKVDVVAEYIRAIRPDATVVPIKQKLEGMLLDIQMSVSEYIVDCTDSPRSQIDMYNKCKHNSVNYIRAGYDGTNITVTSNVSGWIRTDVEEEHYNFNPSWVVPSSIVAALAVAKMEKFPNQEVALDISEIGIPVVARHRRLTARCRQPAGTGTARAITGARTTIRR